MKGKEKGRRRHKGRDTGIDIGGETLRGVGKRQRGTDRGEEAERREGGKIQRGESEGNRQRGTEERHRKRNI